MHNTSTATLLPHVKILIFEFFFCDLQNNFQGKCLLYGVVEWKTAGNFAYLPGNISVCEFNIYLHVGIAVLYASSLGAVHVFLLIKERKNEQ